MPSVTVNVTRLDYAVGMCRMSIRHPVNLAVFVLFGLFLSLGQKHDPDLPLIANIAVSVFAGLGISLACIGFGVAVAILGMTLIARRDRGVLGEHTFRIVEQGLIESTPFNETLHKWGGVRSVSRSRHYIYVRVTTAMGHIIPRRSFAGTAADDEFWNALQPLAAKKNS